MTHSWLTEDRRLRALAGEEGGARTAALETAMAERLEARHAIAVASPLIAFQLAYRAGGRPAGATVLTSSLVDPAVVRAAVAGGQRLRFADVDARGHLAAESVAAHAALHGTPDTVVASHLIGHPCDVASIAAAAPGALVIEDALDALGAADAAGRPIGSPRHAAMAVVGIHPVRTSAPPQGAVILTDDVTLAARCRTLREERAEHRLSELHAALSLIELGRIGAVVELRARVAARYELALAAQPLATPVAPAAGTRSAWSAYLVGVPAWLRSDLHEHLRLLGIGGRRLAMLLHRHPYFGRYADALAAELPATERFAAETLVLPTGSPAGDDVLRVTDAFAALRSDEPLGAAVAG
jgi:dTDP-4-amino-4,6-dideoxygalactose transaminase